ncbi:MAG: hypothetical protein M1816_001325 [Peltula sp. TS41687]|nr:MAG: hypothetical protein M1816_001325 [Peltula sp. TS41687]
MAFAPHFKKAYWALAAAGAAYFVSLALLCVPWVQRQYVRCLAGINSLEITWADSRRALYAHNINPSFWLDPNDPERFGFLNTPDGERLYAWHVLPIGLYTKHEGPLQSETFRTAENFTKTAPFRMLKGDPESRLVINFHGNAGTVAQGWRTDTYRALSSGSTDKIHVLTVDYRGFGYSSGSPTEQGIITDAMATVNWALHVAKIPPERIVLLGQSLGTAIATAVAEHFSTLSPQPEFAGLILIAAFSDIPKLMLTYNLGGFIPILSPLYSYPILQKWFSTYITETWNTTQRLGSYVRNSAKVHLTLIHAKNDFDIPWKHSDHLFYVAANATSEEGLTYQQVESVKKTIDLGEAGWISTWNAGGNKLIRQELLRHGGG